MEFKDLVFNFITGIKARVLDGLTLAEVGQILVEFLQLLVEAATRINASGDEKKKMVLDAVAAIWGVIEMGLPIPLWLKPFWGFIRSPLQHIVLAIASGAVEAILANFKARAA